MKRITIAYPNTDGTHFDLAYYMGTHMPMAREAFQGVVTAEQVWKGLPAGDGKPAPFHAVLHLTVDDVGAFFAAFAAAAPKLLADVPNYTNVQPTVGIEELV